MGRIVVSEFVSLDGVMEAPGGEPGYKHTGWVIRFPDEAQFKYKFEEVLAADAQLLGRKTYEVFAEAWPARSGDFAERMNSMPKYVASTTLKQLDWNNAQLLHGDIIEAVRKLKADVAGDILVPGSRTLAQMLKQHDLVDEYRLVVFPIVLGSGFRLFDNADDATTLRLVACQPLDSGSVILTYHPARDVAKRDTAAGIERLESEIERARRG